MKAFSQKAVESAVFQLPYDNISTLRLENVSAAFDKKTILDAIPVGTRVRVMGLTWEADSAEDILSFYDRLGFCI